MNFTIIIPTRNRPQYLAQAVSSVLAQKNVSLEILVVDDGNIALPAFSDVRIKTLSNRERGPVRARNLGVTHATGDHIGFLDDDDWWTQDLFLQHSLALLRQDAQFTFADGMLVFDDGSENIPFAFDADAVSLETNNSILISTVCYARALHQSLGLFDERLPYYWDWDWYLRVARSGATLKRLNQPVVSIRMHAGNMSSQAQEMARRDNLSALAHKHDLAPLVLKNHLSLASE